MANNPLFYDTPAKSAMDNWTANLNSGFLQFMTGSQPALNGALTGSEVAKLGFGATAFGASVASAGTVTATANAITSDTNATGGTIGYAVLLKSDGTTVVATCSVGVSGADINIVSLTVGAGATVSCSALTVTQPQT